MKKLLHSPHNDKGFILPTVLFLLTIIMLYFSANLLTYSHDIYITHNMIEQWKSQSLFQMAYTKYKRDNFSQTIINDLVEYDFPDGNVHVKVTPLDGNVLLEFMIITNNDFTYHVTKLSKHHLEEDIE